jgi:hypothetical protein
MLGKFGGQEHHVDLAHETKVTRRLLSDNLERKDQTEIKATLICVDVSWVILGLDFSDPPRLSYWQTVTGST